MMARHKDIDMASAYYLAKDGILQADHLAEGVKVIGRIRDDVGIII